MTENRPPDPRITTSDYRTLLGEAAWSALHPDIRDRFSLQHLQDPVTYEGKMTEVRLSFAGRLLAQLGRLIGTPLATRQGHDIPTRVDVYPDRRRGGIAWDRHYQYPMARHERVISTKRICPQQGLVELIGGGFGMALAVRAEDRAIVFRSHGYFWQLGDFRFRLPSLLSPGETTVQQKALDRGLFEFTLDVVHPWLGRICYQRGIFREASETPEMPPE